MKKLFVLLLGFMFLFMGCGALQIGPTPQYTDANKAAYLKADMEYVKMLDRYFIYKESMSLNIQAEWEAEIEPIFHEAGLLLDAWKLVLLQGGDIASAEAEYIAMKNKLIDWMAANLD